MEGLHQFAEAMRLIYGIQVFIIFSITITFLVFIYKKYERGKKIKVSLILFLLWMCYVVNFFFHTQIHYVKQNIKAKYYLLIKDYDKAMDAYLDIQVYDAIESKIEDTYIKGVAYYYDNAKYRECIKFIDKTEDNIVNYETLVNATNAKSESNQNKTEYKTKLDEAINFASSSFKIS